MAAVRPLSFTARLQTARFGRLATVRPDGRPHVVPCCFALVGGTIVTAVDEKPKSTTALRRLDNIRATGWAELLVDHVDEDWSQLWWVRVSGPATVVDQASDRWADAVAALVAKYEQYRRNPPAGPAIIIDVEHWSSWEGGGG